MKFYPALKYRIFTPYYDWFISLTMPEKEVKSKVISLANFTNTERVLDFGSGTGTLAEMCLKHHPGIEIVGLEVDEEMIEIANNKKINGLKSQWFDGKTIPFSDEYFDKVISTWVFHHLTREEKINAIMEIKRVLKPGGLFVVADWGKPSSFLQRILFFFLQVFDSFNQTFDNVNGLLPTLIKDSGFTKVESKGYRNTLFGTLRFWICT